MSDTERFREEDNREEYDEEYDEEPSDDGKQGKSQSTESSSSRDEIPETLKLILTDLKKALRERSSYDLQILYEREFVESDRLKDTIFPNPKVVSELIGEEKYFTVLYKELYFRHVYHQSLGPSVDDRFDSFENYIDLLDLILGLKVDKPEIDLPIQWLWDILDEFIFQFRSFHEFRTNWRQYNLTEKDLEPIKQHQHLWSAQTVIEYLHELSKKGGIDLSKSWYRQGGDEKSQLLLQKTEGIHDIFVTLSQFSLIGLSRVYCLLGDYTSSIKVLDSIDLANKRSPFNSTVTAKVTLYYYMGFAYLMLRRYADAVKTFSFFLVFINRSKHLAPRHLQSEIEQKENKMYGLLAIANALSPQTLDEVLVARLKDRLKNGGFERVFEESCPNFICPAPPDYSQPEPKEPVSRLGPAGEVQKNIFLSEIRQRANAPQTYGYLKMCTNVHISKLGAFLKFEAKEREKERLELKAREEAKLKEKEEKEKGIEKDKEKDKESEKGSKDKKEKTKKEKETGTEDEKYDDEYTATILLKLKHKARNLRWTTGGSPSSGRWTSSSEVEFFLDKDVVNIVEHKAVRRYGDFFIRNIIKYQEMIDELRRTK